MLTPRGEYLRPTTSLATIDFGVFGVGVVTDRAAERHGSCSLCVFDACFSQTLPFMPIYVGLGVVVLA